MKFEFQDDVQAVAYQTIRDATFADGLSRASALGVLDIIRWELLRECQEKIDGR